MERRLIIAVLLCAGAMGAAAAADDSTPRGAAKVFAAALRDGDAAAAKAAAVTDDHAQQLLDAMTAARTAERSLNDAGAALWGHDGRVVQQVDGDVDAQVDAADLQVDGDKAVLTAHRDPAVAQEPHSMSLRRVDGHWKVDIPATYDAQEMERQLPIFTALAQAARTTLEELKAGKFHGVQDARTALERHLLAASMGTATDKNAP